MLRLVIRLPNKGWTSLLGLGRCSPLSRRPSRYVRMLTLCLLCTCAFTAVLLLNSHMSGVSAVRLDVMGTDTSQIGYLDLRGGLPGEGEQGGFGSRVVERDGVGHANRGGVGVGEDKDKLGHINRGVDGEEANPLPLRDSLPSSAALLNGSAPLLTLFTTFKVSAERSLINHNTLHHWSSLRPAVRPVLFATPRDNQSFLAEARALGWLVYDAPALRLGYPVVREMFTYVRDHVRPQSLFIGYANSDIVFTEDLCATLSALTTVRWRSVAGEGLLLVGLRTPVFAYKLDWRRGRPQTERLFDEEESPTLDGPHSLDYFLTTSGGFPFSALPDFVVGKPGYDNWLLDHAVQWRMRVIDCTSTLTALHQVTTSPSIDGGWYSRHPCLNHELVQPYFANPGAAKCTPYLTHYDTPVETQAGTPRGQLKNPVANEQRSRVLALYRRTHFVRLCTYRPAVMKYPAYKSCEDIVARKRKAMEEALRNAER